MKNDLIEYLQCDVLVAGSGGAGSQAAQAAAEEGLKVIVISKDPMSSSDTKICEGVISVRESGDITDTKESLSNNIKLAGGDLPDKKITEVFAEDSKRAYDRLRERGLRPSINKQNNKPKTLAIAMGGHNKSRSVGHKNSGLAFGHVNWDSIIRLKNISYLEDCWLLDIVVNDKNLKDKKVCGGIAYEAGSGKIICISSNSLVIASGGLSTLFFPKTDTMRGNTGDSYALALRAGADLLDMEQIQFLPFCIASPPSYEGLLAGEPSTASFLGVIRDKNNKIILDSVYLRTRAECSEAIMRAVDNGNGSPNGGAFLDMTDNVNAKKSGKYFIEYLKSALPSAYNNARQALGKEAAKATIPWEVRPSAHYMMGGIRVDENCKVIFSDSLGNYELKGLYAAGQAMGGLFGANRLGSTSLTELTVFGNIAGKSAAKFAKNKVLQNKKYFQNYINKYRSHFDNKGKYKAYKLKIELQKECWEKIGPARTERKIKSFLIYLNNLAKKLKSVSISENRKWNQQFIDYIELINMAETAKAIALAALERDGSLGGHVRLDVKNKSIFESPYSTIIINQNNNNNNYMKVKRLKRERTALKKVIFYKIFEKQRLLLAKAFRFLPYNLRDRILEKKYKKILGTKFKKIQNNMDNVTLNDNHH